jgi:Flp pilus assembly protein TadG
VLAALAMPLVIAGAGFGVEVGYDYYVQVELQQAADSAAFAGGVEKRRGSNDTVVTATATAAAQQNGLASADSIQVSSPASNSVQTVLTRSQPRIFSAVFISTPLAIVATALAAYDTSADACILALDPSASGAANFAGNSDTTLTNCAVMANSISSSAISVQGSAQVTTPCLYAVGGVSATSGAHLSCAAAKTGLSPIGDPYASLTLPSDTGACLSGGGQNLTPGRYCNGLTLHNSVSFAPGVYVFSGGTLRTNANAVLTGSGVTFVFLNNATIDINGNATVNLSAPTSGPYAGMLMMGAKTNVDNAVTLNGNAASSMTGAIYFPAQDVSYIGNFSGANGCTQIVAKTISWSGSTSLSINCSAYGMQSIAVGGVSLVG